MRTTFAYTNKRVLTLVLPLALVMAGCPEGGGFPVIYAENETGDSIEVVSIVPSLPLTGNRALDLDERVYINMRYHLESLDVCHVFAMPMTDGELTEAPTVSGSPWLDAGEGEFSEWISFSRQRSVDQLLVYMTDDAQEKTLLTIIVDAPMEWIARRGLEKGPV